ncbi:MAG UNVERIFIED_CONTAM: S-layer homology domain-containing protein, partial [Thermobifida fusca]
MASRGITRGCNPPDDNLFCVDEVVTRGQMAAFLNRALRLPEGSKVFSDTAGHLFEDDIAALGTAGITRGCNPPDNTLFCPDDPVTRGQMAAFLTRALDLAAGTEVFADTARHHFEADIAALAAAGITRGCNPPDNTLFCPDDPVTRGQMAAFLY